MAGKNALMGGETDIVGNGDAEARSALQWWLDAGVDAAIQEQPRDWLKPAQPRKSAAVAETPAVSNLMQPSHDTLAALRDFLASSSQLPLASSTAKRIMPQGPEDAPVMLLSDAPALEDFTAGQPIGGEA